MSGRVRCPICKRQFAARQDGRMRYHFRWHGGAPRRFVAEAAPQRRERCPGSGLKLPGNRSAS